MRTALCRSVGLGLGVLALGACASAFWYDLFPKRVAVVEPGRLVRGAWQRPGPLRDLIARERVRTVLTLTAINADDPKYRAQEPVLRRGGVDWIIVPMRGSSATMEEMAAAADVLADPARRPVFFHCVAGHHRSSLAHAAYLIRHRGWSASRAWDELTRLPWTRPDAPADRNDRRLIDAFEGWCRRQPPPKESADEETKGRQVGRPGRGGPGRLGLGLGRVDLPGPAQLRADRPRKDVPVGADAGGRAVEGPRP